MLVGEFWQLKSMHILKLPRLGSPTLNQLSTSCWLPDEVGLQIPNHRRMKNSEKCNPATSGEYQAVGVESRQSLLGEHYALQFLLMIRRHSWKVNVGVARKHFLN